MRLYFMGKGQPILPKRKCVVSHMKGGYVPLLLDVHHGAGMVPVSKPVSVDMSRTKNLLAGMAVVKPKKKFISI